jgi:hypothetical protein
VAGKKLVRTADHKQLRDRTDMGKAKSSKGFKFLGEHLPLLSCGDTRALVEWTRQRKLSWQAVTVTPFQIIIFDLSRNEGWYKEEGSSRYSKCMRLSGVKPHGLAQKQVKEISYTDEVKWRAITPKKGRRSSFWVS